jgi:4'-phosphopantetheinyl transferase
MWSRPPRELSPKERSLHVWRTSLVPSPDLSRLAGEVLSEVEKKHCARFIRAEDRARCAAARAVLRIVLSKYVSRTPRGLPILTGESGKPYLDTSNGSSGNGIDDIQFSVAHAENLLQIAVSRGARVGIDIERIRDVRGMESIVDDFFDQEERACVRSRKGKAQRRVFFRLWTRREATAKAMGLDLFDAFARCELPAFDESPSGFRLVLPKTDVRTGVPAGHTAVWWIRDFIPAPGYAGALCVEQVNADPSFYTLRSW